jgi:hypothetical protein
MDFCNCEEWKKLKEQHSSLFVKHESYGWLIRWIELTKEKGYSQANAYGIEIKYCPMCGKKLD